MTVAYVLLLVAFLDNFAMLPTIAPYAEHLGAGLTGVGVVIGAYSLTNLVFNVVGGVLLDRAGRRRLLVVSLALISLSMLCYPLVSSVEALVAIRLLHGVGGGILVPAVFTVLGDLAPPGAQGRAMGRAGAVIGVAAVVGPALAGALRQVGGFGAVFLAVAFTAGAGALLAARVLPAATPSPTSVTVGPRLGLLLQDRAFRTACLAAFVFTGAVGSLAAFLPGHVEGMGFAASVSGGLFTLFAIAAAAIMVGPLAALADSRGARGPTGGGLGLLGGALGLLAAGPMIAGTTVAAVVFGAGFGLAFPAMASVVAGAAGSVGRGRAFGLFMAFYSLGFVTVPPLGGAVGDAWPAVGPFLLAAVLCALASAAVLASRSMQPPDRRPA
jgi:MFS transporter, DHA1 family, multidrug resistance protein